MHVTCIMHACQQCIHTCYMHASCMLCVCHMHVNAITCISMHACSERILMLFSPTIPTSPSPDSHQFVAAIHSHPHLGRAVPAVPPPADLSTPQGRRTLSQTSQLLCVQRPACPVCLRTAGRELPSSRSAASGPPWSPWSRLAPRKSGGPHSRWLHRCSDGETQDLFGKPKYIYTDGRDPHNDVIQYT